jgi:hypothetical protein
MTMLSDSRILVAGGTVTSPMTKVERAEQARAAGQLRQAEGRAST